MKLFCAVFCLLAVSSTAAAKFETVKGDDEVLAIKAFAAKAIEKEGGTLAPIDDDDAKAVCTTERVKNLMMQSDRVAVDREIEMIMTSTLVRNQKVPALYHVGIKYYSAADNHIENIRVIRQLKDGSHVQLCISDDKTVIPVQLEIVQ